MEEEKPKTQKEEAALSVLQQAKKEKSELQAISETVGKQITELRELNANAMLAGNIDSGTKEEAKPAEVSPQDYAEQALSGTLPDAPKD